jgi:thiol-disulfide isomerase/thioredoxin
MNIPTPDIFKTSLGKAPVKFLFRPALALALVAASVLMATTVSFSGLAMAGTPALPEELKQDAKGRMVLLDFYSAYCGTCQMMEPHLKALQAKVSKDVLVERVDLGTDGTNKYMDLYAIQGTPTYVLFDPHGKPLYRMGDMITPVVLERQVLRLTGQLKTVNLPEELHLPKPTLLTDKPLSQMILLSFESANCKQCQSMAPYLQGFELAGQQGLQVVHLDTDTPAGKKLMESWSIKTLPAYMLLDNGPASNPAVNKDAKASARPELFRMAGKIEPRALWDLIRLFGDSGV